MTAEMPFWENVSVEQQNKLEQFQKNSVEKYF